MIYELFAPHLTILSHYNLQKEKPFGKQTSLFEEFFDAADRRNANIAVCSPQHLLHAIQSSADSPVPAVIKRNGLWRETCILQPSIVWDRYYSPITGPDDQTDAVKTSLQNRGLVFINPLKLTDITTDKAGFQRLMTDASLPVPTLIASELTHWNMLPDILTSHGNIVLKPRYGRMGRGIIRIRRDNDLWRLEHQARCLVLRSPSSVVGAVREWIHAAGMDIQHYMIQEEIQLPHAIHRYFDIRCLVQRHDARSIIITGLIARVSPANHTVPNIDQGGLAMDLPDWLQRFISAPRSRAIIDECRSMALRVYTVLEAQAGPVGEAGMDFIVDKNYNLLILEVNAKPGRYAFHRLSSGFGLTESVRARYREIRRRSVEIILEYAESLRG